MKQPSPLAVEETGSPDGPPVLFLHGFMSSNLQWSPNREALGRTLRLLLVEQPGHGRSPGPDDPLAYRADTVLPALDRIREERGIERLWLVGQSLGGAIAIRYAIKHPDRVAGLVFTNSRAVFGLTARKAAEQSENTPDPGAVGGDENVMDRDRLRRFPYHPINAKRLPPDLKAAMVEAADNIPLAVFRHLRTGGPWHSTDDLERLTVPTLLINGKYETAFQPCVDQAEAAIPNLRVVHLDGGHSVNIDQPDRFNRAVLSFVQAVGSGSI